jgi:hypothetical protein
VLAPSGEVVHSRVQAVASDSMLERANHLAGAQFLFSLNIANGLLPDDFRNPLCESIRSVLISLTDFELAFELGANTELTRGRRTLKRVGWK